MKIQPFEKRALSWSDVDGANELKESFRKFNDCYKICNQSQLNRNDYDYFTFCDDLLRHRFNKPFCATWRKCPEELIEFAECVKLQLDNFILKGKAMELLNEAILPKWNSGVSNEENNDMLETLKFASYNKAFSKNFTIKVEENKNTHFIHLTVEYGDLKTKQLPYFSTSASGNGSGGQCQNRVLPEGSILREFWEKWDYYHLQTLTNEEYDELMHDIEIIEKELENEKCS